MKKFFLIKMLLFLSFTNIVTAEVNIVFIDMEKIISASKPGMSILKQLNEINDLNIKNFEKETKELKKKEKTTISQKNILSEDEFKTNINNLKIEIKKYNENRNKKIIILNKLKINSTKKFLKLVDPILKDYSEKNSISMIFRKKNVIIGKTELDITNEIIKIINNNIKEFKINDK